MQAAGAEEQNTQAGRPSVKAAIEQAAARLFAEQGFGATGVQQIVDLAGVNKAMLYYYFRGKEPLYDALIGQGLALLQSAVCVAEQDLNLPVDKRLKRFLATYLSLVAGNPDLAQIIYREALRVGEHERPAAVVQFRECVRRLAAVLESCAGELDTDTDFTLAAYSLFGMANMFIQRYVVTREALDVAPLVEHIADLFLYGAGAKNY
jgi:AcrR family transcriptional regulator